MTLYLVLSNQGETALKTDSLRRLARFWGTSFVLPHMARGDLRNPCLATSSSDSVASYSVASAIRATSFLPCAVATSRCPLSTPAFWQSLRVHALQYREG